MVTSPFITVENSWCIGPRTIESFRIACVRGGMTSPNYHATYAIPNTIGTIIQGMAMQSAIATVNARNV